MTETKGSIRETVNRHVGLLTTAVIFVFVVTEVLVASRMNVTTATAIISSAGAFDVALGVLTASYSAVILILLFVADAWRAISNWKPIPVFLEAGLLLVSLLFLRFLGALLAIAMLVVFNLGDAWFERRRGIRPDPWRAGGTGAMAVFVAVFLFGTPIWVPSEVIAFQSREPVTGYVVGIEAKWVTILVDDDRSILTIHADEITDRLVCTTAENRPGKSVLQLVIGTSDATQCAQALAKLSP